VNPIGSTHKWRWRGRPTRPTCLTRPTCPAYPACLTCPAYPACPAYRPAVAGRPAGVIVTRSSVTDSTFSRV
jgi:hypothetical protein